MTQALNPFAGVRDAQISGSGNYLGAGNYELEITKMEWVNAQEGYQALVVAFTIIESDNPKFKAGQEASWFQKKNESFKAEAKAFCIAAVGYDHRKEEHAEAIRTKVEPHSEGLLFKGLTENRLKGRRVKVTVFEKPQKKNPTKNFSKHVFGPSTQAPLF